MTDPTITIAGLRAQVESLEASLRGALDDAAAGEEMRLICEAENAAVAAERTAVAAQLAEARASLAAAQHAGTDLGVALDELRSERAHLAACKERIAGLERAADERSREDRDRSAYMDQIRAALGAHPFASDDHIADRIRALTARVAELEARPVLDVGRLAAALNQCELGPRASDIMRHLGPVTLPLPAQDRAEELLRAFIEHHGGLLDQAINSEHSSSDVRAVAMSRALASLGAPPTTPTPANSPSVADVVQAMRDAVDAERVARMDAMGGTNTSNAHLYDSGAIWACQWVAAAKAAMKMATPPAPADVFAGVSDEELIRLFYVVGTDGIDHGEQCQPIDASDRNGIRAVLARLRVTLVAPVDPEQLAADITAPIGDRVRTGEWKRIKEAARGGLIARGIPVTPECGQ